MAAKLIAMASNLIAMASNLRAVASNLRAMAANLIAMASNLRAVATKDGWAETVEYVRKVWAEQGPFDGMLGFSQGHFSEVGGRTDRYEVPIYIYIYI